MIAHNSSIELSSSVRCGAVRCGAVRSYCKMQPQNIQWMTEALLACWMFHWKSLLPQPLSTLWWSPVPSLVPSSCRNNFLIFASLWRPHLFSRSARPSNQSASLPRIYVHKYRACSFTVTMSLYQVSCAFYYFLHNYFMYRTHSQPHSQSHSNVYIQQHPNL